MGQAVLAEKTLQAAINGVSDQGMANQISSAGPPMYQIGIVRGGERLVDYKPTGREQNRLGADPLLADAVMSGYDGPSLRVDLIQLHDVAEEMVFATSRGGKGGQGRAAIVQRTGSGEQASGALRSAPRTLHLGTEGW